MNKLPRLPMPQAYGTWVVTTEGDCEGRSTRNLGTHTGYLDEIAFALADQSYYGLRFDQVDPLKLVNTGPKATKVFVSLDIGTGTWDMSADQRVAYFQKMLAGRDVIVNEGTYYATVELTSGLSLEAEERIKQRILVSQARDKLSTAELEALTAALKG